MAFAIILLFLVLVLSSFFALGLKRVWIVAAPIWAAAAAYTIFVWRLPIDPTEDWRMASLWRMILIAFVVGSLASFAAGLVVASVKSQKAGRNSDLKETLE